MVNIEVNVIHAQMGKAQVQHLFDMLLPRYAVFDFPRTARQKLRRHDDVFPLGKVTQGSAEIFLTGPVLISNGRVKKIDAQL